MRPEHPDELWLDHLADLHQLIPVLQIPLLDALPVAPPADCAADVVVEGEEVEPRFQLGRFGAPVDLEAGLASLAACDPEQPGEGLVGLLLLQFPSLFV